MNHQQSWWDRLGLITSLVERAPNQMLGRTAIVKLAYLLQTLRGVPVGYDFRLYTYGPFNSEVLSDLDSAASLQAVSVETVPHKDSYGYEVRPGPQSAKIKEKAADWLNRHAADLDWVVAEFAGNTASDLELLSTIVYVDRELADKGSSLSEEEMVNRVKQIKPRFGAGTITAQIRKLRAKGHLACELA